MKKIPYLIALLFLFGCGSQVKVAATRPLFEVLSQQEDGGATIRFFEILTEAREIKMLQNDDLLKKKISAEDINTSNFIILNMGEKSTTGYTIAVKKVEETPDKIIVTVEESEPKTEGAIDKDVFYYPYTIVRINSKKTIVIQ
jgi:hypothetical protein